MQSNNYSTTNLYEASFLIARGFKINDLDKDYGRKTAVLLEGEGIQNVAREYYNNGMVSGKSMTDAYRMLKDRIFE